MALLRIQTTGRILAAIANEMQTSRAFTSEVTGRLDGLFGQGRRRLSYLRHGGVISTACDAGQSLRRRIASPIL
jgi:hypothetical protein